MLEDHESLGRTAGDVPISTVASAVNGPIGVHTSR